MSTLPGLYVPSEGSRARSSLWTSDLNSLRDTSFPRSVRTLLGRDVGLTYRRRRPLDEIGPPGVGCPMGYPGMFEMVEGYEGGDFFPNKSGVSCRRVSVK